MEKGDHTFIRCSNCDRQLLDILHTEPDLNFKLKVKVLCPCGDHSYPIEIKGRFHHSPPQEYIGNTEKIELFVDEIQEKEDYILFIVKEIK